MNKKINIKPPIWPKELTFEEFRKLNPLLNENELISREKNMKFGILGDAKISRNQIIPAMQLKL